ncbi:MAG: NAD-binding protein [Chromatocurvus sp.]
MRSPTKLSWRTIAALLFFASGIIAFATGASVTERPDVTQAGLLAQAYYSLSLFVVGGVELGTPEGGPAASSALLWLAYFGSPILAATTLIDVLLRVLSPHNLHLRRIRNHIVVIGTGELAMSYLRVLRKRDSNVPVIIVSRQKPEAAIAEELRMTFDATVTTSNITHEYCLRQLRVKRARRIILLSDNSLRSYEAVSIMQNMVPDIGKRIVMHCANLRFMRAMQHTEVAKSCETFNSYHLAASGLVREHLMQRFLDTSGRDIVVLAGFGRFGQTIIEQLQGHALRELETVAIIEKDAVRRVLVAEEQMTFSPGYRREVLEGDISHPAVWKRLREAVPISSDAQNVVFILGTGNEEDNLRTAIWLRRGYPNAMIIARSSKASLFAEEVGREHNIITVSIHELVEQNIPDDWM